jgi:hypothetical protein
MLILFYNNYITLHYRLLALSIKIRRGMLNERREVGEYIFTSEVENLGNLYLHFHDIN